MTRAGERASALIDNSPRCCSQLGIGPCLVQQDEAGIPQAQCSGVEIAQRAKAGSFSVVLGVDEEVLVHAAIVGVRGSSGSPMVPRWINANC